MRAFILITILTVSYSFCFAQTAPTVGSEQRPPTVLALKVADPGDAFDKRKTMIDLVHAANPELMFKQVADANGLPDFYATDKYDTSVEIAGKEDSLVMVQWTFRMIFKNSAATKQELGRMRYFAMLMGGDQASEWFANMYSKFKDKPLDDYTESSRFYDKRIAEFKYLPHQRKITLTITTLRPGK